MTNNTTTLVKAVITSALLLTMAGCKTVNNGANMAPDIVTDSIKLNEAYNDTSNAIILKNILRARDRWPTSYTTLSGIDSNPTASDTTGFSFSPLGLGNAPLPFSASGSTYNSVRGSGKSYKVSPFAASAEEGGKSLYSAISEKTFQGYMQAWPQDVVTLLMVQDVSVVGRSQDNAYNDGENQYKFVADIAGLLGVHPQNFNLKKDLKIVEKTSQDPSCTTQTLSFDQIIHTKNPAIANIIALKKELKGKLTLERSSDKNEVTLKSCETLDKKPVFTLSEAAKQKSMYGASNTVPKLNFNLRSFDGMIYYLGEVARMTDQNIVASPCDSIVPSPYGGYTKRSTFGPVFKIVNSKYARPVSYAARVKHDGENYVAGPNFMRSNSQNHCPAERTSTALSLLTQLLILNQSSDFLKAPENTIIR